MKAITTKYLPATNTRGSRIKATDHDGNTVTRSYYTGLDAEHNHIDAALELCAKMKWTGELVTGSQGNDYVHVWYTGKTTKLTA